MHGWRQVGGKPRDVNNKHLLCCGLKYEEKIVSSPTGCSALIFFCNVYAHIKHEGHQTNRQPHDTNISLKQTAEVVMAVCTCKAMHAIWRSKFTPRSPAGLKIQALPNLLRISKLMLGWGETIRMHLLCIDCRASCDMLQKC